MEKNLMHIGTGATAALSLFVEDSLRDISVWISVMMAVIVADLMAGTYKVVRCGGHLRVSKGLRDTMGKVAVYFSFTVAAVFAEKASGLQLARYACLLVIAGEGLSIVSNLLKAHGFSLDLAALLRAAGKKAGVDGADTIIRPDTGGQADGGEDNPDRHTTGTAQTDRPQHPPYKP